MGQVLHGCVTTTEAVRRAIQNSQESLRTLANRYGINQKTVRKWRNRSSIPIFRPARKSRGPQFCPSRKRRSSSHSAGIHCCRSMIVFMRCRRPSRI
jgi:hypothetical protein